MKFKVKVTYQKLPKRMEKDLRLQINYRYLQTRKPHWKIANKENWQHRITMTATT